MGLPVLKNDKSGGFIIIQVSNGSLAHKMRFHVPSFGAAGPAADGIPHDRPYLTAVSGREASLGETFYELAVCLRGMYSTDWQFSLAACYQNSAPSGAYGTPGAGGGILTPVYPCPSPHTVRGTSSNNNNWLPGQVTVSFHTVDGGRFSLRMLSSQEWDPTDRKRVVDPIAGGGSGSTPITITSAYLEGLPSGVVQAWDSVVSPGTTFYTTGALRTMIEGRDGSTIIAPAVLTNCMNKRVRRSLRLT